MKKTIRNIMCRFLALAMVLTVVSIPMVSNVSAEDEVIWTTHYEQNFDKLNTLTSDDKMVYTEGAAKLKDDSTGGKYLEVTPKNVTANQADGIGTDGKWAVLLKAFDSAKATTSNKTKISYKAKFTTVEKIGTGTTTFGEYSTLATKIYQSGRSWATRITPVHSQLTNQTAAVANGDKFDGNDWFNVSYIYDGTNLVATIEQNGNVINTQTKTAGELKGYLFGCDATGYGIYVDDVKVSYGYNKPENLAIDFEGLEADSAFTHDKVFMQNTTAIINKNDTDGTFLRMSCTDSASATKNSVQIKAFDGFSFAEKVTVEYSVRIPECDACPGTESTNDSFTKHPGLNTKIKGFQANGTTTANTWATRVAHYKTQANNNAVRDTVNVGTDWFTVKHVIDNSVTTNNLTTTVTAKDGTSHTNTATYVPATIAYYELVVTDIAIVGYLDVDNFTVTYSYGEEETSPTASVKVYAENEIQSDLENASMLTDKVVVSFSEEMEPDTINENTVYIENAKGDKVVCGAELDTTKKIYTMTIPSLLAPGTYKVVVTDGAMSAKEVAATPAEVEFTVSSDTPALPQQSYTENFVLNFDDMETGDATNIDGVIKYNSGVGAKIVSGGVTGNCLSVVPKNANNEADPIGTANKWSVFFNKIDTNTNANQVKIEYDVKLIDTETLSSATYGGIYAADKEYSVKTGQTRAWANRIGTTNVNLMESTGNVGSAIDDLSGWIRVTYLYDKATNTMTGSYSQNGITINSGVRDMTARGMVKAFILGSNSGTGEEIYLDNFAVTYIYNKPTVTAESITIGDVKGEAQDNWNNIDPRTKNIKIDFGATMNTSTLNNTNIYLSKDGETTKVPYIPTYEDGVYTMSFTENLAKSTTYTLYVEKAVANAKGVTLDDAVSYEIKTGKGIRKAELMAVKIADNKVTSVNDLKNVTSAKLEVDYSNTTGEDQKLNIIIAFYAGDTLKTVELVEPEIDGDVITMTYGYDFNMADDMGDVTAVKVMVWSTFGEMVPLSDSIDI